MHWSIWMVALFVGFSACVVGVSRADDSGGASHVRTAITGQVVLSDGSPAAGASVALMLHGGSVVAEADGSFSIEVMLPAGAADLSLVATLDHHGAEQSQPRMGTVTLLSVDAGGAVEAGVVVLESVCEPGWVSGVFAEQGMNSFVYALTVFDDGNGPALYAGGLFTEAGGKPANRIARWDGTAWSPLGAGLNQIVTALTVFDDGSGPALYAGGSFTEAGGKPANRIARWDGTAWSPLGAGLSHTVYALTVFDDGSGPALYVGGGFAVAGEVLAWSIARWDGTQWSALGAGMFGQVLALEVFDDGSGPALYAGGNFTYAGEGPANRVARWDGESWSALGVGMSGGYTTEVRALKAFDDGNGPALYAGGVFSEAGGSPANCIARWDKAWSPLGEGVEPNDSLLAVATLTTFDDGSGPVLYAGGSFSKAGGNLALKLARWDGANWSALGVCLTGTHGTVLELKGFDDGSGPALFVGGKFNQVVGGGQTIPSGRIAKWQGCAVEREPCVGDLNGDGIVDADDLGILLAAFGSCLAGDLNGDGVTDTDDLGILLTAFGGVCE